MLQRRVGWILTAGMSLLMGLPAAADPVDNPGPFTLTLPSGYFLIGNNQRRFDVDPTNPPMLGGSVDGTGAVALPQSEINFPDATITVPGLGNITVRILARSDGTGSLDAFRGDAIASVSLDVNLIHSFLPVGCGIRPIDLTVTTGTSGTLTGVPYDQALGTATYVSNDSVVPGSSNCGLLGGLIDAQIGLPAAAGVNKTELNAQFSPIFTGS